MDKNGKIPVYSSESTNNGISGYTNNDADFIVNNKNPVYIVFGDHTRSFNIATESFCVMDNVKVISINSDFSIRLLMFIISSWKKGIPNLGYSRHWSLAQKVLFQLPIDKNEIDFEFIEEFVSELEAERISELEAYLSATGLKDYTLTKEEQQALDSFDKGNISVKSFSFASMFDNIKQGRRLKKADQITGHIPFVMAGVTNTGVVDYISNPIAMFPNNAITIDIFGNTFYRSYEFGAGDDTGVYWSESRIYSKEIMLYLATAMNFSIKGRFSYGKKLRSSQSLTFKMQLPTKNQQPDYEVMEHFISAVQKLVIKDVVLYADSKIKATKSVIKMHQS